MAVELVKKPAQKNQYTNLAGISDASKKNLNYYGQGYNPSQQVNDARSYLQSVIDQQPGEYQSRYAGTIDDLYSRVMSRPDFKYDVNKDAAYQQYKQHYTTMGQRAMQDTVGNAAALTGGYGNSWAATAGSQAYQQYLQQLNDMVPQLEQQAYARYNQEGEDLRQNLGLAQGLENADYGKYRDTIGDWQQNRSYAAQRYDQEYQNDYNAWMNMLSYWQQLANAENQNYWNKQNYDFQMRQYEDAQKKKSGGGGSGKKVKKQANEPGTPYTVIDVLGEARNQIKNINDTAASIANKKAQQKETADEIFRRLTGQSKEKYDPWYNELIATGQTKKVQSKKSNVDLLKSVKGK
jgi:hypothetical protein